MVLLFLLLLFLLLLFLARQGERREKREEEVWEDKGRCSRQEDPQGADRHWRSSRWKQISGRTFAVVTLPGPASKASWRAQISARMLRIRQNCFSYINYL